MLPPVRTRSATALARDLVRPGYAQALAAKAVERAAGRSRRREAQEARRWCESRTVGSSAVVAAALGTDEAAALWREAEEHARTALAHGGELLPTLWRRGVDLGGGGDHRLLYFLTRWTRPTVVVETGVAAGWSSRAVLAALERNGHGELWSTDLPYPGLPGAAGLVGVVVPQELRGRWHLHLGPDARTVPAALAEAGAPPDLVHYDSDKSRRGRDRTLDLLWSVAAPGATLVVDDIGDNLQFRDWTGRLGVEAEVLTAEGKHVGLLAKPPAPDRPD